LKILHVAAGISSDERPHHQPFIKSQINSLLDKGIECEVYEIKSYKSKLEYFKSVRGIRKILNKGHHDLIHAHYSYCGIVAHYASRNIPVVLSLMGSDLLGTPGFDGKQTLRGRIDGAIARFAADKVDHVVVKSNRMGDLLKCKTPVSVIPNGVNLDIFKPIDISEARKNLGFNAGDFLILFLGNRALPVKNFKLASKSYELFKQRLKDKNIKFVNPFGIGHSQVVEYMSASNVLLLTSFWEGSPNVVKEAMACNLPIVATDVGDVKDIIENTENCFTTDFSENEIAEKLDYIYQNKKRSNGREKINKLSNESIAERLFQVYQFVSYKSTS
jgi:glycosyltransferase involved in cell wall biosynthesis